MKKVIALGLAAAFSSATFALADDVTVIKKHREVDPDTTGSVVIKQRHPVVKKKVIKEKHNDPDVTIKGSVHVD